MTSGNDTNILVQKSDQPNTKGRVQVIPVKLTINFPHIHSGKIILQNDIDDDRRQHKTHVCQCSSLDLGRGTLDYIYIHCAIHPGVVFSH